MASRLGFIGLELCPPQVGFVTVICATCFTLRALIVAWSALDKQDADLDVWQHPLLDIIYYSLVEIVPSALVLFILRCLTSPICCLVLGKCQDVAWRAGELRTAQYVWCLAAVSRWLRLPGTDDDQIVGVQGSLIKH